MKIKQEKPILQVNPKAAYLAHKAEIDAAISRVLDSGWYILGKEVTDFEEEFAAYIGVRYAIGVASGTDALEIAIRACGIGPADTVFTVSHTAVATVAAIEHCGSIPILLDIDPTTFTIDPNQLEDAVRINAAGQQSAVNDRQSAVIPVHLYGHPADMSAIMDIAGRYDLYVIEDCAQAHGSELQGRKMGSWGHLAAFSFYPTKNLGALGDGGAVVTNDADLAERVRLLRQYGWRERNISELPGGNSRLDELQAAILRVKLNYLDQENERRREIAGRYHQLLQSTPLKLPVVDRSVTHIYHQYVVRADDRDGLQRDLMQKNINTAIHYPIPVHLQPAYNGRLREFGPLPITEKITKEILSLPMFPALNQQQISQVAVAIKTRATAKA